MASPRLSICISTLNRGNYIGETLRSIAPQLTDQCELLVLDNASTDNTSEVVIDLARHTPGIRYIRKETNDGLDRNFDRAVELASGEYCWLMSDDDLLKPGAVAAVLAALQRDVSVVFVNIEFRDFSMSRVLQRRCLNFDMDRTYGAWELDRLFTELRDFTRYIGAVVIRRDLWLSRERRRYYDSYFLFVGVLFQSYLPGLTYVIAEPLVAYRAGNTQSFAPQVMEILLAKWPSLIASFPISNAARGAVRSAEPWKYFYEMLMRRACGGYSLGEYKRWVLPQVRRRRDRIRAYLCARCPGFLANALLMLYFSNHDIDSLEQLQGLQLDQLKRSPYHLSNLNPFRKVRGNGGPAASSRHRVSE